MKGMDATPERRRQLNGRLRDVPTERAGITVRRVTPTWEVMLSKGMIDDRQAGAAAAYAKASERVATIGYQESILNQAGAKVDRKAPSAGLSDAVIRAIARYRSLVRALGDDWILVEGIAVMDLAPRGKWQANRFAGALNRVADVLEMPRSV